MAQTQKTIENELNKKFPEHSDSDLKVRDEITVASAAASKSASGDTSLSDQVTAPDMRSTTLFVPVPFIREKLISRIENGGLSFGSGSSLAELDEAIKLLNENDSRIVTFSMRETKHLINDDTLVKLATAFQSNTKLQEVILSCCFIGNSGIQILLNALKSNKSLVLLDLWGNNLNEEFGITIRTFLETNTSVTSLSLGCNQLGKNGVKCLAKGLIKNKTLTTLKLQENKCGLEGIEALGEALKVNRSLTSLNIIGNNFEISKIKVLAEALSTNTTLAELDLEDTIEERDEAGEVLAKILEVNNNLTYLKINERGISETSGIKILEALKRNKTLKILIFSCRSEQGLLGNALAETLKTNNILTELLLWGSYFNLEELRAISEVLKTHNRTIVRFDYYYNPRNFQLFRNEKEAKETESILSEIKNYCKRNQDNRDRMASAWGMASITLACFRADPKGKLNNSIKPLIPGILNLLEPLPPSITHQKNVENDVKERLDNKESKDKVTAISPKEDHRSRSSIESQYNKFIGTKYFNNCILRKIKEINDKNLTEGIAIQSNARAIAKK